MKVGLSTWSLLTLDLNSAVRAIGDAGFRYLELWGEVPHAYHDWTDRKSLKDTLSAYDFTVTMHAPFTDLNPTWPFQPVKAAVARTLKDFVRFSDFLGATRITIHPGSVHNEALVSRSAESAILTLREVVKESEGRLAVNIENQVRSRSKYHFPLGSNLESTQLLLSEVGGAGFTLDTGHAHVNGDDPSSMFQRFRERTTEVHLSDNDGSSDDHLVPGEGTAVLQDLIAQLATTDIFVCLELNPFKYSPEQILKAASEFKARAAP